MNAHLYDLLQGTLLLALWAGALTLIHFRRFGAAFVLLLLVALISIINVTTAVSNLVKASINSEAALRISGASVTQGKACQPEAAR